MRVNNKYAEYCISTKPGTIIEHGVLEEGEQPETRLNQCKVGTIGTIERITRKRFLEFCRIHGSKRAV